MYNRKNIVEEQFTQFIQNSHFVLHFDPKFVLASIELNFHVGVTFYKDNNLDIYYLKQQTDVYKKEPLDLVRSSISYYTFPSLEDVNNYLAEMNVKERVK